MTAITVHGTGLDRGRISARERAFVQQDVCFRGEICKERDDMGFRERFIASLVNFFVKKFTAKSSFHCHSV